VTKQLLLKENKELKQENAALKYELGQIKKLISGSKSERFTSAEDTFQLNIFKKEEAEQEVKKEQEVEKEEITYQRDKKGKGKHPGRHKFPSHLEIEQTIIEPDFDTTEMVKIGEEVTDRLTYTKASLKIRREIRVKYKSKETEKIQIAPLPSRAIPKCIATNSLLAHIMVSKMIDHLPFYRQAQIFSRDFQWDVSRGTLCHWLKLVCELLEPLYQELIKKVVKSNYINADESPLKVLEYKESKKVKDKGPPDKKVMQGYMWVYRAIQSGLVFFNYRKGRGMQGPKEILKDYKGYVQCDGYSVYDKMAKVNPEIKLVGCHAHVRRKFYEAKDSDSERANYVLNIYQQIYAVEKKLRTQNSTAEQIKNYRQEHTKPLLANLKIWIEQECVTVIPKSPMGKAMTYFQNQWHKLIRVVEDGNLEIDNNQIENKIRPLALGRKNYMFAGSHNGAYRLAMMYSFFASCKAKQINPQIWLTETLDVIADHPINRLEELLPGYKQDGVA
jgi:transposase